MQLLLFNTEYRN